MKSSSLFPAGVAAIALGCAPFAAPAQNVTAGPVLLGRTDLTLLPGPHLLSPARGAAQPQLVHLPSAPASTPGEFRFVRGTGTPPATSAKPARAPAQPTTTSESAPAKKLPDAETLRFDAKL